MHMRRKAWRVRRDGVFLSLLLLFLWYSHFVRASWHVIVAPFHDDGVTALVLHGIGDVIELVAHVLDVDLLTGSMGSVHAHHQHVGTWMERQEGDLMIVVYKSWWLCKSKYSFMQPMKRKCMMSERFPKMTK